MITNNYTLKRAQNEKSIYPSHEEHLDILLESSCAGLALL
jgi:hypothetical protein